MAGGDRGGTRPWPWVLCATVALVGCTQLGPDYREPEVEWLAGWQPSSTLPAARRAAIDREFWWQLVGDPALTRLITVARNDSPSLRVAGLRILESRAALGIARSNLLPQQQVTTSVTHVNQTSPGSSFAALDQSLLSSQADFSIGWELDFWGRFARGVESADAAFFGSIANQQDVQVLLTAQVADLYYAYRTTQLRIRIARDNARIQGRSLEITENLFGSGSSSELDVQQARTQYLSTLSTIPDLELSLVRIRNALGVLLGRPPGPIGEIEGDYQRLPSIPSDAVDPIAGSLLVRRPDIRLAAWQVAAQSARIGIAEADLYPSISLFGGFGWQGTSVDGSTDFTTFAFGPALRWNVFDHGRIMNNVRVEDARLQQLIEGYRQQLLVAAREIDDALVSLVKSGEQALILEQAVAASRRALALANSRYREGYAGFQRVLDAQRAVAAQDERYLVNQGNHVSAAIALYKALGGGWTDTPVEQWIPDQVREQMRERTDWGPLLSAPMAAGSPTREPPAGKVENDE